MPKNTKISSSLQKIKPFFLGTVRGLLIFCAMYFLLAFIMYKTNADMAALYYLIYLFIILGGFICGVYVYKKVRGRGFLTGIIASVPYSVAVFLIFCLLNSFNISSNILLVLLLTLSGGFLGGITAANTKI